MERKSYDNLYEKQTFSYSEIANAPKLQSSNGNSTISFSKRSENAHIQIQPNGDQSIQEGSLSERPIEEGGELIDSGSYAGLSPCPHTEEVYVGLSPTPHIVEPTPGRSEVFVVPVATNNTRHNCKQSNLTYNTGTTGNEQVAKLTLKDIITKLPYKLMVLSVVVGAVLALLLVVPAVVVSMTKDSPNHDSQKCLQDNWSDWTKCSTSCGRGVQIRMKGCSYAVDNTEFKQCSISPCDGDDGNFNLLFDQSTRHSSCYLSNDNRIVSNFYSLETPNSPYSAHQLQNYHGVIGQPCIKPGQIVYYEIGYSYNIISSNFSSSGLLVLDFGLAEKNNVDSYHHIGDGYDNEWAFSMYKCENVDTICFSALHMEWIYEQIKISGSVLGTMKNGTFGILVDRRKNEISVYDIQGKGVFHKFIYVESDIDLCPVFGPGYNPNKVHVTIKLFDSYLLFPNWDDSIPSSISQVIKSLIIK